MKLRYIILASALVASLAACSGGGASSGSSEAATSGVAVKEGFGQDPTIIFDAKQKPPTDLVIQDLVPGDGQEVPPGATVTVNYKGVSWVNGGQVFDSSFERGEPITFPLDQVIPGWRDGLVGQKVNGRRLLIIPPNMGYGAQSPTPAIAPNDTLVFVVDLLAVESGQPAGDASATEAPVEATGTDAPAEAPAGDAPVPTDGPTE
ncbi:FKBP-type peptidyl-prolyl cis-trans isomerase [Stomatohabitans albus]|uniref:FKBP-type peptidyl-prolyl cis-trans isomerase n=1 Tax=Stomatohabitans albus TaxID=3110766 RepID=UPI00300D8FF3